jgi:RNA polymerase sigma-70 factor (ECF subfamily)
MEGNSEIFGMDSGARSEREMRNRLVALLASHQRRIFAYLQTLVPDPHAAEDLLQETCLVISEKFHEFTPGTDFLAWAFQIAWWRVRAARQKFARSKILFDDDVLEAVATTARGMTGEMDCRREALSGCLQRLPPRDRDLVLARYEPGGGVSEAARRSGRSVVAAYKALARIRKILHDCVSHRTAAEGTS